MNNIQLKNLDGKVQTVLGLIDPDELGIVLTHEHIYLDLSPVYFIEPNNPIGKCLANQKLSLKNLSWVRRNRSSNIDNLKFIEEEKLAINETMEFKLSGGKSIVELTNYGIKRDPKGLARVSLATGLNIIMGSGFYIERSISQDFLNKTVKELSQLIVRDILNGAENTCIHSGIIGEIGCSYPFTDFERKSLQAAAIAQQMTGASINLHPSSEEKSALENINILEKSGADLNRVIVSHIDYFGFYNTNIIDRFLERGCYVEFDTFGMEGYNPDLKIGFFDCPTDIQRIKSIIKIAKKGYIKQILMSCDNGNGKHQLHYYGGFGYDHLLTNILPLMRELGMRTTEIDMILKENPKRILTFVSPK